MKLSKPNWEMRRLNDDACKDLDVMYSFSDFIICHLYCGEGFEWDSKYRPAFHCVVAMGAPICCKKYSIDENLSLHLCSFNSFQEGSSFL